LYSLFTFQPDLAMVAPLPLVVKYHIVGAFLILLVFPFSRLVHMISIPITYLWRPYQVVQWNWDRKTIRGQYTRGRTEIAKTAK
jgi:nitrate reductase gamma subunit